MATTTTNFGWDIPQSTDLVKDGATAIAALGQDIDTAFVDFKGGTTGQVLKKTSGTDLDVEWGTASSGLTLINTTSFSAVAAQNVDSVFSSTYENYRIIIRAVHASGSIKMQGRVSGTTIATDYGYQRLIADNTSVTAARSSAQSDWFIAEDFTDKSQIAIELGGPNVAEKTTGFVTQGRGLNTANIISLIHGLTSQFDGIRIYPTSGTMTGTVSVYGYAK